MGRSVELAAGSLRNSAVSRRRPGSTLLSDDGEEDGRENKSLGGTLSSFAGLVYVQAHGKEVLAIKGSVGV